MQLTLIVLFVLSQLVIAVLLSGLLRARRRLSSLEAEAAERRELAEKLTRLEREQRFVTGFIREFPTLLSRLHSQMKVRSIPRELLAIVDSTFEPRSAVVLIRRRPTLSEPERGDRFIVAAASPRSPVPTGTEVGVGEGELGYIAEAKRAVSRSDLDRVLGGEPASGPRFPVDLGAPMVIGDQVVGVVALAAPARHESYGPEILRLVAQLGADTFNNVLAFNQMKSVADMDSLTGIFNKRVLTFRLAELVYAAQKRRTPVSVFIFDLDHFKSYNDLNGHVAGDELLRMLAQLVSEGVRTDDIFGRFGGEEFLLILPDRTAEVAASVADKIRQRIEGFPFPFGERQPMGRVTVSGGIAAYPENASSSTDLLKMADAALYEAKRSGRNCVVQAGATAAEGDLRLESRADRR